MTNNPNHRLEIFCDGVIAIAITLLILEIKVPPIHDIHSVQELKHALLEAWPHWFGFVLSFLAIFISWFNHHAIFKLAERTSVYFFYANGFFLLTIVMIPFSAALMSEYILTEYAQPAVSVYCLIALLHNLAWNCIGHATLPLIADKEASRAKMMIGNTNTRIGFLLYLLIFVLSFWFPICAMVLITLSWVTWFFVGLFVKED
jgi:uncharacterized membrane protein